MRHRTRFLLFIVAGSLLAGLPAPIVARAGWVQLRAAAGGTEIATGQQARLELRTLPPNEYVSLRIATLAHARETVSAKKRNPRISTNGLDPKILGILAEQRANQGLVKAGRCDGSTIRSVNGKATGAIFTPMAPDNHYKIEGCSFGRWPGAVKLAVDTRNLPVAFALEPITLQLDSPASWSDREIDVHLDPRLSGIPDFAAILVVYPANGREIKAPGCQFVAVRGFPQLLKTIPAAWVRLDATFASLHPIRQLEYVSPSTVGEEVPRDAIGTSVFVVRSDSDSFVAGVDTYDFSQLNAGWVVDSVQLERFGASCPGDVTVAQSKGTWATTWIPRGFAVAWASDVCESYIPPVFSFTLNSSQYAAKVWVIGPAGTQQMRTGL
jgi:hypothetical protein